LRGNEVLKKLVISIGLVACIAIGLAVKFSGKNNNSLDDSFKEFTYAESTNGALKKIRNPKYLDELVGYTELIVKGEVLDIKEVSTSYNMQEGTAEKAISDLNGGKSSYTVHGVEYTIRISDTIKGKSSSNEIILYLLKDEEDLRPEMIQGDNYIFLLNWNDHIKRYIDIHPTAGYYKVGKGEKVSPVYKGTAEFKDLQDKDYDKVKTIIKNKVK
jgi:hypothetical protein